MDIRIFDQPEDLNQVRLFAAQLTHAVTLPTQHWSWAEAFAHTVAHKCELRFIVALEGGRALALLPLVRQPTAPHFELLNLGHLYEPVDVVCMDPTALRLVAAALAERHDLFLFHRVPANSPLVGALREETLGLGLTICRPDAGWPSIALADQWTEPESKLNTGRRSDLRRARRRAEALGPVSLEMLRPAPEAVSPLLAEAYAIEASGWKGAAGSALAVDPVLGPFFRLYAAAAARDGILRLGFLKVGDRRMAMLLAVELAQRLWLLKMGYDERFARCSPGMLLISETVRYAARCGLKGYEFLGTAADWTRVWTQLERPCLAVHGFGLRWRGLYAFTSHAGRWALDQLVHRRKAYDQIPDMGGLEPAG